MHPNPEAWKTVRWLGVTSLAFILIGWLAWLATSQWRAASASLSSRLGNALAAITQSKTHIVEGRAEILGKAEISELSLLDLRMSATRSFESERYLFRSIPLGSRKLVVQGHYRVTAGYRLEKGASLRLENGIPVATFGEPQILAVELLDFSILSEKDNWANRLSAEDRSVILRELRQQIRIEAVHSGALDQVKSTLKTRLSDLLNTPEVRIESPSPKP